MALLVNEAELKLDDIPAVGAVGTKVSLAIHDAVLAGGEPARNAADLLHGTWLGHPLHPVLTDITIGAWVLGGVCDAVGAAANSDEARKMGDRLTEIGVAASIPTALTGLTDFSTFPEPAAVPATIHGAMNLVNIALYGMSVWERRRGNRLRGVTYSAVALGLSCISAWLGGVLVYKHRVGVDHRDEFKGPKKYTPVMKEADLPQRKPTKAEFDDKPVLLFREGQSVYAIGATCSHAGGPLDEGKMDGLCVQCPWHDSVFDMRDGRVVHGPATQAQPLFRARIREGRVEIRLERP